MKNTTTNEYYVVKMENSSAPDGWYEVNQKFAFIEDVEERFNTQFKTVRVFKRKVVVEEEEIETGNEDY